METIYSPNNIEFLLWCHTSGEPHPRFDAPAIKQCLGEFLDMGAIEEDHEREGCYRTTLLGRAWVAALCATPPPRMVFVDVLDRILAV